MKDTILVNMPSKEQILEFIRECGGNVDRKDIAKYFNIKSSERIILRKILKELEKSDELYQEKKGDYTLKNMLPLYCVMQVCSVDDDAKLKALPMVWKGEGKAPKCHIENENKIRPPLGVGEKFVGKNRLSADGIIYTSPLNRVETEETKDFVGIVKFEEGKKLIYPTDKGARGRFSISPDNQIKINDGDLVLISLASDANRSQYSPMVVIKENLGKYTNAVSTGLIALAKYNIRRQFSDAITEELKTLATDFYKNRDDIRNINMVTIDGEDAKDFDDAVYAEKLSNGGYKIIVAIADVSFYVKSGSYLDVEAQKRGNSVYLPSMVVPMLPFELSNNLCSLRPNEDRPCIAVEMIISATGEKTSQRFFRCVINSKSRLTYSEVQKVIDKNIEHPQKDLINQMYDAYQLLRAKRAERGALNIEIPETKILIDDEGNVKDIIKKLGTESNQLIEEFMVLANVAAAEELIKHKVSGIFRIHEPPDAEKLKDMRPFFKSIGYKIPMDASLSPIHFNKILEFAKGKKEEPAINEIVLRMQSQAQYNEFNKGHFGLGLKNYVHFTSPIRRYSDLIVHRSLIKAFDLGNDGLTPKEASSLSAISAHISSTERTAVSAERETTNRFCAAYLSKFVDQVFDGTITGITKAGVFVKLDKTASEGLIVIESLPDDYYEIDDKTMSLKGTKRSFKFTLGDKIKVMIKETNPISGTTRLKYVDDYLGVDYPEKSDFSYQRNAGQKSRKPKLNNKSKKSRKNKRHK